MKSTKDKLLEILMYALSITLGIGLFIILPTWLGKLGGNLMYPETERARIEVARNIIEGILRLAVFIAYIKLVSLLPDIRRVFMYHGAEHKTVNAYEGGSDLSVEDVKRYPTFHPRCGTSFIFFLIIVHIVLFTLLHIFFPFLNKTILIRFASRIVLIPLVAGIAYECIRITGKHHCTWWSKLVIWPGQLFQRMTSLEPSPDMIEVAVYAFKGAMGDPSILKSSEQLSTAANKQGGGNA